MLLNSQINKISLVPCLQTHSTLSAALFLTICHLNRHTCTHTLRRVTSLFVHFTSAFSLPVLEHMYLYTDTTLQHRCEHMSRLSVLCWINPSSTSDGRIWIHYQTLHTQSSILITCCFADCTTVQVKIITRIETLLPVVIHLWVICRGVCKAMLQP